jgi:ATP-dependent helicase/DNAse subunit B
MSLGIAVHEVLEGLGDIPAHERMNQDLRALFEEAWLKVEGKKGGFKTKEEEEEFKSRGKDMINTVIKDPKMLVNKRIKLPREMMNPNFYLSEEDNIILNGLVDWIEYLDNDTLHIIDFKTGKKEESEGSLQLPIYLLLCNALQKRKVSKASYWYLESDKIVEKELPDAKQAYQDVLVVARTIKEARTKGEFVCPQGDYGCMHCNPYEKIVAGDASIQFVGKGTFKQDLYMVK